MATRGWLFYLALALIFSVCPGKKKVSKEVRNCTFKRCGLAHRLLSLN